MKHRVVGRKLGRTSAHRLAVLRNLSSALFLRERITTTLGKAKELRPFAERLVTLSKRESLHARRQVLAHIHEKDVVSKLFDTLSARYAQRPGGYTRILKLGPRRGDNAEMAIIELVGYELQTSQKKKGAEAKAKGKLGKGGAPAVVEDGADTKPDKKGARPKKAAATEAKAKSEKPRKTAAPKKEAAAKAKPAKGKAKPSSTPRKSGKGD